MEKNNYGIVIIDSGVEIEHPCFEGYKGRIDGISLENNNGNFELKNYIDDNIGHGTAVCSIITKKVTTDILVIKILNAEEDKVYSDALLYVLKYIYNEIDCKVINISLGINMSDNLSLLKECCDALRMRGTVIVSAFDNSGAVSYPAAFDSVIGVDEALDIKSDEAFEYYENSLVNVRMKAIYRRLPWKSKSYAMNSGISFSCAEITAKILCELQNSINFDKVCEFLKSTAERVYSIKDCKNKNVPFEIKKAIVFPVNKEMHSLIRYINQLDFKIVGFYDIKYSGKIRKKLKRIADNFESEEECIKNIEDLNWEDDFDTVILGHTGELQNITKIDFRKRILENCRKYGKKLYSFDSLAECGDEQGKTVYWPEVSEEDVPYNTLGKLYLYRKPILGVFGTSSVQGKFTLQMALRNMFIEKGYKVGQLGTEPSALLYGMDDVFPIGYNSTVRISNYDSILYINKIIHDIEDKEVDITIVGCQSGTVQFAPNNLSLFYLQQFDFLVATQPDCIVLCVNVFDEEEYIERTIKFIEGATEGKVIALAYIENNTMYTKYANIKSRDDSVLIKERLQRRFELPAFKIGDEADIRTLSDLVEQFFAE